MSSAYDPRITAYFGDAVMRAGFMPTPHLFLRHYAQLGLGHAEAMFVLQLMEINWDLAAPPKTVNDIAQRMGVNARTVRRYSEAVAELGLVTLYDQYDDSGAQIENGYDLSPLFERLATFAPEPPLGGQIRRQPRRKLPEPASVHRHSGQGEATGQARQPPPDNLVMPSPDNLVTPPRDRSVTPAHDRSITGRLIDSPGLKKESRILQEHHSMMHDESSQGSTDTQAAVLLTTGWSLRRQQALPPAEVEQTDAILQRIGIDLPVRSRIRTSLAPDEAWTVWTYALAKRWSVPLLINAVYNKAARQARPADIPREYDTVGRALAQINPDRAEQLLRLVADHCPHASSEPFITFVGTSPAPEVLAALEAVWGMIAELRKASGKACPLPSAAARQQVLMRGPVMTEANDAWQQALAHLRQALPDSEFVTWFETALLVDLDMERAVIGVPNIFVRDHLTRCYQAQIAQALSVSCGHPLAVQIEIGGP